jgi:hypothetical protein
MGLSSSGWRNTKRSCGGAEGSQIGDVRFPADFDLGLRPPLKRYPKVISNEQVK